MELHNIWPFVSGLFYLHNVFRIHPCCSMYQYFIPFLRLNNIPLSACITFCLSIHQLMGIWVVSSFWLLRIMLGDFSGCPVIKTLVFHGRGCDWGTKIPQAAWLKRGEKKNNVAMNICVQIFLWKYAFILLGLYLKANWMFNFLRNC